MNTCGVYVWVGRYVWIYVCVCVCMCGWVGGMYGCVCVCVGVGG